MIYPAEADIVPLIGCLVQSLQPYAEANEVSLSCRSNCDSLVIQYEPFALAQMVMQLLCQIINLVPHQSKVKVELFHQPEQKQMVLTIENTGINLLYANGTLAQSSSAFTVDPMEKGTRFCLTFSSEKAKLSLLPAEGNAHGHPLPQFYAEFRKRLRSHYTQAEKMVEAISHTQPREAAFLQKINALIKANLSDENFDTTALCKAMSMSRTQLFRRLKPLIRQAPALYIKTIRLQRAKELLEAGDLTVSEVAFKTGFQNLSHFTKVFQQHYGVLPSVFRRNKKPATNE